MPTDAVSRGGQQGCSSNLLSLTAGMENGSLSWPRGRSLSQQRLPCLRNGPRSRYWDATTFEDKKAETSPTWVFIVCKIGNSVGLQDPLRPWMNQHVTRNTKEQTLRDN
ncbi:MAG: hypothetical protein QG577_2201 [Thermodesulfobacteriota bacterium]|nr:hypothetical protein [Thermodesulfobacteriota bacterium]